LRKSKKRSYGRIEVCYRRGRIFYGQNRGSCRFPREIHKRKPPPQKTVGKYLQEIQEPSPQPGLSSYNKFIEGGRIILETITIPLLYELDIERGRTHRWMQFTKSKKVEDVGLMEEKVIEMRKELSELRMGDSIMKEKLQEENMRLRERL